MVVAQDTPFLLLEIAVGLVLQRKYMEKGCGISNEIKVTVNGVKEYGAD